MVLMHALLGPETMMLVVTWLVPLLAQPESGTMMMVVTWLVQMKSARMVPVVVEALLSVGRQMSLLNLKMVVLQVLVRLLPFELCSLLPLPRQHNPGTIGRCMWLYGRVVYVSPIVL